MQVLTRTGGLHASALRRTATGRAGCNSLVRRRRYAQVASFSSGPTTTRHSGNATTTDEERHPSPYFKSPGLGVSVDVHNNQAGQSGDVTTGDIDPSPLVPWTLRTLFRHKLTAEDYVDLSDAHAIAVHPNGPAASVSQKPPVISYGWRVTGERYTPFPVNTRGFFYYHPHPRSPFGGSIRFRVAQTADPTRFPEGQDLLNEYGTTWEFPLLAALHLDRYSVLRDAISRCAIVTPKLLAKHPMLVKSARGWYLDAHTQCVNEAREPFYVDLADWKQKIIVPGDYDLSLLRLKYLFLRPRTELDAHLSDGARWPFTGGRLLCRLEVHERHEPHRKLVAVRVLRILEPVRLRHESLREVVTAGFPLTPGKLLAVKGSVVAVHRLGKLPHLVSDTLIERDAKRSQDARRTTLEPDGIICA
ncbi:hypothetical protein TRAPUB_2517 [Trametes pubescens]|uniref:Uncharacterized protein n=1 Tax=Trametes pubescens TaxID=154538 RepID=A0A1M2VGF1_TRAPU|nr:hypothetical protein TRAPUB_2517 [Trametes pubescens]